MQGLNQYKFKELGSDEKMLKLLHRHWFNILQQFLILFFLVFILAGGLFFFPSFSKFFDFANNKTLLIFAETTVALFVWVYAFFIWIDYYFDIWIITDKRIINVEQKGLFRRQVSELKFERIQDVTTEVTGFIPTVLNYGDVYIQTAGETERFVFRQIPDPYNIKTFIMNLQKEAEREETNELGEMIKEKVHEEV